MFCGQFQGGKLSWKQYRQTAFHTVSSQLGCILASIKGALVSAATVLEEAKPLTTLNISHVFLTGLRKRKDATDSRGECHRHPLSKAAWKKKAHTPVSAGCEADKHERRSKARAKSKRH